MPTSLPKPPPATRSRAARCAWPATLRAVIMAAAGLALGGCASGSGDPLDLFSLVPETAVRVHGEPLPPTWVRLGPDMRPLNERGERKYLGTSTLGDPDLVEPTSVVFLRTVVRDLAASGACRDPGQRDEGQPYVLELVLERGVATYGEGLENLLLVLPTSSMEATCSAELRLKDRDGRPLLVKRFESRTEGSGSLLGGLRSAAARTLARALRESVDAALQELRDAPERYWARFGRKPPIQDP